MAANTKSTAKSTGKTAKSAAKKASAKSAKKSAKKSARASRGRRKTSAAKRLSPRKEKRGLAGDELLLPLESPEIAKLVDEVRAVGGAAIGAYREPFSGRPQLMASLPITAVEPTPFQRDLSPTHTKRLAQKIEESGSFLDPLIVVRGEDGQLWTPNGRHRLAAAKVLGLRQITALVSPDEDLAFKILALNTEKAHNLKDRSLEVIRMARELAKRNARSKESDYQSEFEAPELITLGIVYDQQGRFAGGAYNPFLKKVESWSSKTLPKSLSEREGHAARLLAIDSDVKRIIGELQERGFKSPYLRTYVVARINPVRFHRAKPGDAGKPAMPIGAALTRMAASARKFDTQSVKQSELALVAAVSSGGD